jgi:TrmH family RNA methyltransferase
MASISRVKVHYGDLYEMIKAAALPVYAAIMEGEASRKVKFPKDVLLVIGNEGQGVSPAVLKLKSKGISIEKRGLAESLNAAMAGAILLDRYFGQFD